jgi:hypothetical protein
VAKKKSTKSAKSPSDKKSKNKEPKLEVGRSFTPDKTAVRPAGGFSGDEIGHVAGDVWGVLNRDGGLTLAELKKSLGAPADIVVAAIGWLAREGKLEFATEGRTVKISLR